MTESEIISRVNEINIFIKIAEEQKSIICNDSNQVIGINRFDYIKEFEEDLNSFIKDFERKAKHVYISKLECEKKILLKDLKSKI